MLRAVLLKGAKKNCVLAIFPYPETGDGHLSMSMQCGEYFSKKKRTNVIATGVTHTLEEFVAHTFACLDLDWREDVIIDPTLLRPSEIMISRANPAKAYNVLGWKAQHTMENVVKMMIDTELSKSYILQ